MILQTSRDLHWFETFEDETLEETKSCAVRAAGDLVRAAGDLVPANAHLQLPNSSDRSHLAALPPTHLINRTWQNWRKPSIAFSFSIKFGSIHFSDSIAQVSARSSLLGEAKYLTLIHVGVLRLILQWRLLIAAVFYNPCLQSLANRCLGCQFAMLPSLMVLPFYTHTQAGSQAHSSTGKIMCYSALFWYSLSWVVHVQEKKSSENQLCFLTNSDQKAPLPCLLCFRHSASCISGLR